MTRCRYVIARFVPDPIRDEPINVGVILQSSNFIGARFIPRLPRSWITDDEMAQEFIPNIHDYWRKRLEERVAWVFIPEKGVQVEVPLTSPDFLVWLRKVYNRQIQFTEMREAEVDIEDRFKFDTLLVHLYNTFVTPKPKTRRVIVGRGTRLHTYLRHDFQQLKLFDKVNERGLVEGTILWEVDFVYRNGYEVALLATDFNMKNILERATHVLAAWSDLKDTKQDAVRRISIVGNYRQIPEHRNALRMIERYATTLYNYETEKPKFTDMLIKELGSERFKI